MNKYEINIFWSNEDDCFVVEVPEFPGCAAHGETHELALANAKEAMALWIDTARQEGRPIPQPQGQDLTIVR
jgi:predicted RNase H-like HicB family nuclease